MYCGVSVEPIRDGAVSMMWYAVIVLEKKRVTGP